MTAEELLKKASACLDCGKAHQYRQVTPHQATWAADDGHAYRPVIDTGTVAKLRFLMTGKYESPWVPVKKPLLSRMLGS